ncbi:hypothetical protein [Streptosporangium sp. NPDC004631]
MRVYDETIRFDTLIVDGTTCVVRPYPPQARGVDPPTIVINDNTAAERHLPGPDRPGHPDPRRDRPALMNRWPDRSGIEKHRSPSRG